MSERQMLVLRVGIHVYFVVAADGAGEDGLREVVEEQALDGSLHGSCTKLGVIALAG